MEKNYKISDETYSPAELKALHGWGKENPNSKEAIAAVEAIKDMVYEFEFKPTIVTLKERVN